jgi:hypothetical protein
MIYMKTNWPRVIIATTDDFWQIMLWAAINAPFVFPLFCCMFICLGICLNASWLTK